MRLDVCSNIKHSIFTGETGKNRSLFSFVAIKESKFHCSLKYLKECMCNIKKLCAGYNSRFVYISMRRCVSCKKYNENKKNDEQ